MDAGAIAALNRRYRSRIYERALDLLEGYDAYKLYQFDVLRSVERVSDICDKVDSTITHNC